jgi:hypothetical protein
LIGIKYFFTVKKPRILKEYPFYHFINKEIEERYLMEKKAKWFKFNHTNRSIYKCIWTYSSQKRLEGLMNWRAKDLNYYDDFRPIYEPILVLEKIKYNEERYRF